MWVWVSFSSLFFRGSVHRTSVSLLVRFYRLLCILNGGEGHGGGAGCDVMED